MNSHGHSFEPSSWPFSDPVNAVAISTTKVVHEDYPVLLVTHDEDGDWQILCGTTNESEDALVICLGCAYQRDNSIGALADLPLGWAAWRNSIDDEWKRDPRKEAIDSFVKAGDSESLAIEGSNEALTIEDDGENALTPEIFSEWRKVCLAFGADFLAPDPGSKMGFAIQSFNGNFPIHGLRHLPTKDTNGWYIWSGEEPGPEHDFFKPLHIEHAQEYLGEAIKFLGMAPGWRFLFKDGCEDIWFDQAIVHE